VLDLPTFPPLYPVATQKGSGDDRVLERGLAADLAAPGTGISMFARRALFAALVIATTGGMLWLAAVALAPGGFEGIDLLVLLLFAATLPWSVIGFWNATIGFLIMRLARDPVAAVLPAVTRVKGNEPITATTAILVCIRNEVPERVVRNLEPMIADLVAAGVGERFHLYVLSDTDNAAIAGAEELSFGILAKRWDGRIGLTYRRRSDNAGFKAGNVRDFCKRWGDRYELAITLDADSFMPASAVLRLVRIMQADAGIGILQGLVVGLPSTSAFARIFQFGMRLGMRSWTIGSAWWQGDCGVYWGHNAAVRLKPFIAHCELPEIERPGPLGGPILSHDHLEAVLMRRAGYEVRVLPEEELGWEENPPTLLEFIRRDLRWCQGNMQYFPFLRLPGLTPVNRFQVAFALIWFLASPAWIGLLLVSTAAVALRGPGQFIRPDAGLALFAIVLVMWFAPKIASVADVLLRPSARRAFGGTARFVGSVAVETVFFLMLSPILWLGHTLFLGGLMFGRTIGWIGQTRDDHAVPWSLAIHNLWPHAVLGIVTVGVLAATAPSAIPYALFIAGGPLLAIPLAVVTASPALGRVLLRLGIGRLPEETAPSPALSALALPAVEAARPEPGSTGIADGWRAARGILRSLRIYYGDRQRRAAMDRLYGHFVRPGDLVFDVGAHVGDRVAAFRRLGARVVAVEPQPAVRATLMLLHGRDGAIAIEAVALGRAAGTAELKLNLANPTVSTASPDFIRATAGAPGWEGQTWDKTIKVPMTTLDVLVTHHGAPAFIKVDVEGLEADVLAGLSRPVPALSFEFTTVMPRVATAAVDRCVTLGYTMFNAALGESQALVHPRWLSGAEILDWLAALPPEANSGDVYARLP
jgi:membrane glycosyltransferase